MKDGHAILTDQFLAEQSGRIEKLESQVRALCYALESILDVIPDLDPTTSAMVRDEVRRVMKP